MPQRMLRRFIFALLSALVAAGGVTSSWAHEAQEAEPRPESQLAVASHPVLAVIRQAPDFVLWDSAGHRVALSAFRGKVVLLSFIYTTCTTTCPLLTHRMTILEDKLQDSDLWPKFVSFLSVTVDPERDTAAVLADYAKHFHAVDPDWQFLRDEPARVRPILSAYGEWTRPLPNGELDHPARVYLIDQRGNIREIYALSFFDERQAFIDIQTLIGAHQ